MVPNRRILWILSLAPLVLLMMVGLTAPAAQADSDFGPDLSFGNAGQVTGDIGPIDQTADVSPKALTRDAQGRVLFGAASGGEWQISRFLPSGELDPSFGNQGKVSIASWSGYGAPTAVANLCSGVVRPDGRILLVGYVGSIVVGNNVRRGEASMVLAQLMPDGSRDLTFGHKEGSNLIGAGKGAVKAVFRPDGSFLVGAFKQVRETGRTDDGALFHFTSDGKLDKEFGSGNHSSAITIPGAPGRPTNVFDVDLLSGGRILLSGTKKNYLWLMMLRKDGTKDPSFGKNGQVTMMPGGKKKTFVAVPRDLEIDNKGRLLVAGFTSPKDLESDPGYGLVMRFQKNGRLDKTFGAKGIVRLYGTPKLGGNSTRLYDIQTDTKGGIWATGSAGKSPRNERRAIAVRYTRNGKKDPRFFNKGVLNIGFGDGSVGTALIRAGEKMYLSGRYDQGDQENFYIKRLVPAQ